MAKKEMPKVFTFKVMLAGEKRIWRRIAAGGDMTLHQLHQAIYLAFDRDDEHLYTFYIAPAGTKGGFQARQKNCEEYVHPFALEGPVCMDWEEELHNAAKTKIKDLDLSVGQVIDYLFDYGDCWWHELKLEQLAEEAVTGKQPWIVESQGDSPPQYPEFDEDEEEEED